MAESLALGEGSGWYKLLILLCASEVIHQWPGGTTGLHEGLVVGRGIVKNRIRF
jgi:hypothetical protein